MKIVRVVTLAPEGIIAQSVQVEVAARPGLSALTIVGLPGRAVAESKERVRLALRNLGVTLPATNIVINLAPASLRKDGTHYDLPIALALLMAIGRVKSDAIPKNCVVFGELGLDGSVRGVKNAVVLAHHAWSQHLGCLLPSANVPSVRILEGLQYRGVQTVGEVVERLKPGQWTYDVGHAGSVNTDDPTAVTLDDVIGQTVAKRAVVIAAAGGHPLFLTGPPGVGKTMLAQVVHSLQPPLTPAQQVESTLIHSAAGLLDAAQPVVNAPPWRSPHHTATISAMVGTALGYPGETALAHHGTLFLDELPLFSKTVIESLREPIQNGEVRVSRGNKSLHWPAGFTLVAAANPCPCGYFGDPSKPCSCTIVQRQNYQRRISGPLLDRFGLHVRCTRSTLAGNATQGEHLIWKERVAAARERQYARQQTTNNRAPAGVIQSIIQQAGLDPVIHRLVHESDRSMRSVMQIARVALTIADLDMEPLKSCHIEEALFLVPQGLAF